MGNAHFRLMMSTNHSRKNGEFGTPDWDENTRGSFWMILSMVAFSAQDVAFKLSASEVPAGQVMVIFGTAGAAMFAVLCAFRRENPFNPAFLHPAILLRLAFETCGRLFFNLALALTALSSTVAILQATPLVVVAGAALFFKERVSALRWLAIGVGLTGVVIILRPTADAFSPLSVLAVLGMLGLALRDLATKAAPKTIPNTVLGLCSFLTIIVAGVIYTLWSEQAYVWPDLDASGAMLVAAAAGVVGDLALTAAMRTGDVSVVTPFRYTRLICGTVLGILFFGEKLDAAIIAGSALILVSGLFVLLRTGSKASERSKGD